MRVGLWMAGLLCCAAMVPAAQADDVAAKGRAILAAHKDAVVTVQLVLKMQVGFPGAPTQKQESKSEATGTVINEDGLTVVSLSETDPASLVEAMMGSGGMQGMSLESEVADARILLEDGTEVPAEVVLRDKDLDMAFIRPVERPSKKFAHVDLQGAIEPEILDEVVSLNRLGKVAGRVHAASLERINAVVRKPRTFFVPGNDPTNTGLGSPAFTVDGQFIGVFLIRAMQSDGGGMGMNAMFGGMSDSLTTIILPAADILESAGQAPPYSE